MSSIENAKKKISNSLPSILTPDAFPKFLSFSSNFLNFDYQNVILIYLQNPNAKCVAGIQAWKNLTLLDLVPGAIPILVLYPVIKNDTVEYSIQKVFDYSQIDNCNLSNELVQKELKKCNKEDLCSKLFSFLESKGYSCYPGSEDADASFSDEGIVLFNENVEQEKVFFKILDLYLHQEFKNKELPVVVSETIINAVLYIVKSYYDLTVEDVKAFTFLNLIKEDSDRVEIMKQLFKSSNDIIDILNG